jgi:hypothetical protein
MAVFSMAQTVDLITNKGQIWTEKATTEFQLALRGTEWESRLRQIVA